jgi:hypothetical protein
MTRGDFAALKPGDVVAIGPWPNHVGFWVGHVRQVKFTGYVRIHWEWEGDTAPRSGDKPSEWLSRDTLHLPQMVKR